MRDSIKQILELIGMFLLIVICIHVAIYILFSVFILIGGGLTFSNPSAEFAQLFTITKMDVGLLAVECGIAGFVTFREATN